MGTIQNNTHIESNKFPVTNSANQQKTARHSSPSTLQANQVGTQSLSRSKHSSSSELSSSSSSIREYTPINNEVREVSPLGGRKIPEEAFRALMGAVDNLVVKMNENENDPTIIAEAMKIVNLAMQNNICIYPGQEKGNNLSDLINKAYDHKATSLVCEKIRETIVAGASDLLQNFEAIKNGEGADTPDGYEGMVQFLNAQGLSLDNACFLLINAGTIDGFDDNGNAFKGETVLNFNKNHLEAAAQPYEGSARQLARVLDGKIGDLANNIGEVGEKRALKALAKELNKQDKDVEGFLAQVRAGAHINEEALLNDETVDKLRTAIKEQLFESKGNQKILTAARELVQKPEDPEAIAKLAKAMHAKNMNPEQMQNLVRKMGGDGEDFTPLTTKGTTDQLNVAKSELEAKDKVKKEKRAKLVSVAALVLAVGLGVLAVGMFAAGIAVLASNPLAMPLGIALMGAGGVFTMLAIGAIGGSHISNKEEFETRETARLQQPPKKGDESGKRLSEMLNKDPLKTVGNTKEEDELSSSIDSESSDPPTVNTPPPSKKHRESSTDGSQSSSVTSS